MRNTMRYKGYIARIEYSDEDGCFVGHLAAMRDIVGFHADSVTELRTAFEEAVDDYVEACEKLGQKPERPASGKIMLRMPAEVHSAALAAAEASGKSLNQWATEVIAKEAHA